MIIVIADDFTGAAELGGVGLRYNLAVEINTAGRINKATKAELLIIAADTRSMKKEDAVIEMERIALELRQFKPILIYKKVDSVLRGHVAAETRVLMDVLGLKRALLIPANPGLGRTIRNGMYYLQGQPLHLSGFSKDSDFPVGSSDIQDMLRTTAAPLPIRKIDEPLPDEGIIVGEVGSMEDLAEWTEHIDGNTLLAGAADFFGAVLDRRLIKGTGNGKAEDRMPGHSCLFVSGSAFNKSIEVIKQLEGRGSPVSYMPEKLTVLKVVKEAYYTAWCEEVLSLIHKYGTAIIAIDGEKTAGKTLVSPLLLRGRMAKLVKRVFERENIRELLIEGGSTAHTILQELKLNSFFPVEERAAGVIRMKILENPWLYVTVKPGSYSWPDLSA